MVGAGGGAGSDFEDFTIFAEGEGRTGVGNEGWLWRCNLEMRTELEKERGVLTGVEVGRELGCLTLRLC